MNSPIILEHFSYAYRFCNSKIHWSNLENKTVTFSELTAVWEKKIPKIFGKSQKKNEKKVKITKIYLVLEFVPQVSGTCLPYEKSSKFIREHIKAIYKVWWYPQTA